jgi:RNA polymerase sigma factor for flagellar operon FliA
MTTCSKRVINGGVRFMAKNGCWSEEVRMSGSDAQKTFILSYRSMITRISWQVVSSLPVGVDLNDLVSEGVLGLIRAIERFDPDRGVEFCAYAEGRVRGAILDGLRSLDWMSRSMRGHVRQIEKARAAVQQRKGGTATCEELAGEMDVPLDSLYKFLRPMARAGDPWLPEGQAELDPVPGARDEDPHSHLLKEESRRALDATIDRLPHKDQIVIRLYYFGEQTLREIGAFLGVSESRACQIHRRALARIRDTLEIGSPSRAVGSPADTRLARTGS